MVTTRRVGAVAIVMAAVLLAAGCSSSKGLGGQTPSSGSPSATDVPVNPNEVRPRLPLEFRQVKLAIAATRDIKAVGGSGPSTQSCATLVTPTAQLSSRNPSELLFDRARKSCFLLGPALVTSASLDTASVIYDSPTSSWAVNVHFKNDDFLNKVARPLVGKEVAIVLAGFVQAAPVINPNVTGRNVEIVGRFTRSGAIEVAAVILGVAPSKVLVVKGN